MPQDLTLKVAGLYSDPNPLQEIPNGALKTATNIQIRRRGIAERRPGFPRELAPSSSDRVDQIFVFDGDWTCFNDLGSGNQNWVTSAGTSIQIGGSDAAYVVGELHAAEMQSRLYVTLEDYVARYLDAADTTFERAGMEQPGQPWLQDLTEDDIDGWLNIGDMVAYRSVLTREIGDQLLLSAPSASGYVSPTTSWGSSTTNDPFYVSLRVNLPPTAVAGDIIQLYRTNTALAANRPTTPGDEMFFLESIALASGDISAGYVDFTDRTPGASLVGSALYTNETQQGALLANSRPNRFGCVATYNDMMFGANVSTPQQLVLQMPNAQGYGPFDFSNNEKIWPARNIYSTSTCTLSLSAPHIVVSGWYGQDFAAGMWIISATGDYFTTDADFTAGTEIQSVTNPSAGTWNITLNQAPVAATATEFRCYFDVKVTTWRPKFSSNERGPIYFASGTDEIWTYATSLSEHYGEYMTDAGISPSAAGTRIAAATQLVGEGPSQVYSIDVDSGSNSHPEPPYYGQLSKNTTAASNGTLSFEFHRPGEPTTIGGTANLTVNIPAASGTTFTISGNDARDILRVGQHITDEGGFPGVAGTKFQVDTKVSSTSWSSPTLTVTIDTATNATGGAYTEFTVWDWIDVNGTEYFPAQKALYDTWSGSKTNIFLYDQSVIWSFQQLAGLLCYDDISYNVQALGGGSDPRALLFDGETSTVASITIKSTKPQAFDEDVDNSTGVATEAATQLNRLHWTKVQEPDAWPIGYFVDIGQKSKRILRVLPTRESLFVFKEDGTWRVSGTGPENLRVDEYDRTLKLMHPNAVSQVDNELVGWFVSGVMRVTDSQTGNISDNRIGVALTDVRETPEGSPWSPDIHAFTVERDNQWHLIAGAGTGTPSNYLLVYNFVTDAWVVWSLASAQGISCGVDDETASKILMGGKSSSAGVVFQEADTNTYQYDDVTTTITITAFTNDGEAGDGYAYSGTTSGSKFSLGDVFTIGGVDYLVTQVFIANNNFEAWSATDTASPPTGSATRYEAISAWVEWTAKTQQNPGVRKFFRESNYTFGKFEDVRVFQLTYATDISGTGATNGTFFDDISTRPHAMRALVDTEHGRGFWLNPGVLIPYVTADFLLEGCSLVYEWMNERT